MQTSNAYSSENSLESDIRARAEYNDNIFLTTQEHDAVNGIIITPSLTGIIKEEHWEGKLNARLRINNYSDHDLDSNDKYLDLTARYLAERNIFSLNANYDLDSNLSSTSSDFGIVGQRVNRKNQSITPQYTRLISERAALTLSYTYSDVDYLDAEGTAFTPYVTENVSATVLYDLTEKDKLTISFFAVDYASKSDLVTYQLLMSRIGIEHKYSETLSADFLVGGSRRNTTNLIATEEDFFGSIIIREIEIDSKDRGFVLDAGIVKLMENGKLESRLSRDNTTNSFGGLDQVDKLTIDYTEKLSSLWRYDVGVRFEDITSISSGARATDREVLFFEVKSYYSIADNWDINASYRYIQRDLKSDLNDNRVPHSNRIYVGLTYNFPSLTTF